jgi:hypothetical protein
MGSAEMNLLISALLAVTAPPAGIIAAADAFDRAQLTQDEMGMERMILDDLIFIDGSGKRLGKHAFIAGWLTPGDQYDPITLIDRTVTPLGGDAAVVGAEVNLCGTSDGQRFCSHIRFADTFVRVGGEWRVAHVQVTRIKD